MAINNARLSRSMRKHLHFTYKTAKRLCTVQFSSVVDIDHDMDLSMSPKFIGDIRLGLKETLGKELLTFNEHVNGVPLAFDKIKVIDSQIIDDQDLFKLHIQLSLIIFKPEPGKFLNAVVNKITDHHFGCVIHGCINCSVRQPKMDALTDELKEITNDIEIGDVITFKVWRLDMHNGILFVLGDIIGPCYYHTQKNKQRFAASKKTCDDNESTCDIRKFVSPDENVNTFQEKSVEIKKEEDDSIADKKVIEQSPKKKKKKKETFCGGGEQVSMEKSGQKIHETEKSSSQIDDNESVIRNSPKKKKKKEKMFSGGSGQENEEKSSQQICEPETSSLPLTDDNNGVLIKIEQDIMEENSPKKKKRKAKNDSLNVHVIQEFSVDSAKVKTEDSTLDNTQGSSPEKSPKKKKNKKVYASDDNSHDKNTTDNSNNKNTTYNSHNKNTTDNSHDKNATEIAMKKKKSKSKENTGLELSEVILTKKIFSGDREILNNNNNIGKSPKKKMKKENISDNDLLFGDLPAKLSRKKVKVTY